MAVTSLVLRLVADDDLIQAPLENGAQSCIECCAHFVIERDIAVAGADGAGGGELLGNRVADREGGIHCGVPFVASVVVLLGSSRFHVVRIHVEFEARAADVEGEQGGFESANSIG